jgi:hypothetical protein
MILDSIAASHLTVRAAHDMLLAVARQSVLEDNPTAVWEDLPEHQRVADIEGAAWWITTIARAGYVIVPAPPPAAQP